MYKSSIVFPLLFILICSCEKRTTDNLLLDGNEYKLWYITTSGDDKPQFLYIDCYGIFYTLEFDNKSGYFYNLSKKSSSLTLAGKWKYNCDSSIYLNKSLYSLQKDIYTITYTHSDYTEEGLEIFSYDECIDMFF